MNFLDNEWKTMTNYLIMIVEISLFKILLMLIHFFTLKKKLFETGDILECIYNNYSCKNPIL